MDPYVTTPNLTHGIFKYHSDSLKRIARSVMASGVHALFLGFEYVFVVKDIPEQLFGMIL